VIKYGSYREYQRYLCKDCDRTFNIKTGTIFAHAKIGLNKLLFAYYAVLRFNRVFTSCMLNSPSRTGRSDGASSSSPERSTRQPSISLARLRSTKSTSQRIRR